MGERGAALGSRIKFLVDTSEMIWGALDTGAYLEAAQRFLQASEVPSPFCIVE